MWGDQGEGALQVGGCRMLTWMSLQPECRLHMSHAMQLHAELSQYHPGRERGADALSLPALLRVNPKAPALLHFPSHHMTRLFKKKKKKKRK